MGPRSARLEEWGMWEHRTSELSLGPASSPRGAGDYSLRSCSWEAGADGRDGSGSSRQPPLRHLPLPPRASSPPTALQPPGRRWLSPPPPWSRRARPPAPAMGDLPGLVRLSIALRIQPNDGPVFYKVDGQRFGQNRTIKLLTGSSYKVEVKIKPTTLQVE